MSLVEVLQGIRWVSDSLGLCGGMKCDGRRRQVGSELIGDYCEFSKE